MLSSSTDESENEDSHQDTNSEHSQAQEVLVLHDSEQKDNEEIELENEQAPNKDKETRKINKKVQKPMQESHPKRTGTPKSKKAKKTNNNGDPNYEENQLASPLNQG